MNTQVASSPKSVQEARFWTSEGRRRCMRVALHRGGTARYGDPEPREHVAFVRDFNFNGIYFFSNFEPTAGSSLEVAFAVPDSVSYKRFVGKGTVVRVEKMSGGAIGIAAEFEQCELLNENPS